MGMWMPYPWWVLGLSSATILFILLLFFLLVHLWMSRGGARLSRHDDFNALCMRDSQRKHSRTDRVGVQRSIGIEVDAHDRLSMWVTRIFITIVILCAGLFLTSQCPGFKSPTWFGLVLQGLMYGAAALLYSSMRDETSGE